MGGKYIIQSHQKVFGVLISTLAESKNVENRGGSSEHFLPEKIKKASS
jgi:hypothetical protein